MGRPKGSKNKKGYTSKYGVSCYLPGTRIRNPAYRLARARAMGVKPISRKYGVPYYLPNGEVNPEWRERASRARGVKPRKSGWSKYGVKSILPDGRTNLEWVRRWRSDGHPVNRQRKSATDADYYRRHSKEITERVKLWRSANPEKTRRQRVVGAAKRRGLQFRTVLGSQFEGSHLHHVTPSLGVYIPNALHRSIQPQYLDW